MEVAPAFFLNICSFCCHKIDLGEYLNSQLSFSPDNSMTICPANMFVRQAKQKLSFFGGQFPLLKIESCAKKFVYTMLLLQFV